MKKSKKGLIAKRKEHSKKNVSREHAGKATKENIDLSSSTLFSEPEEPVINPNTVIRS